VAFFFFYVTFVVPISPFFQIHKAVGYSVNCRKIRIKYKNNAPDALGQQTSMVLAHPSSAQRHCLSPEGPNSLPSSTKTWLRMQRFLLTPRRCRVWFSGLEFDGGKSIVFSNRTAKEVISGGQGVRGRSQRVRYAEASQKQKAK
jgi:hypothetical protein